MMSIMSKNAFKYVYKQVLSSCCLYISVTEICPMDIVMEVFFCSRLLQWLSSCSTNNKYVAHFKVIVNFHFI